jgi:hypothetical protein
MISRRLLFMLTGASAPGGRRGATRSGGGTSLTTRLVFLGAGAGTKVGVGRGRFLAYSGTSMSLSVGPDDLQEKSAGGGGSSAKRSKSMGTVWTISGLSLEMSLGCTRCPGDVFARFKVAFP